MNFKSARSKMGFTQSYVASVLGIDRTTYSRYENGTIQPDTNSLIKLSELYKCSTDYLLGRTDSPEENIKKSPAETEDETSNLEKVIIARSTKPLQDDQKKALMNLIDSTIDTFLEAYNHEHKDQR